MEKLERPRMAVTGKLVTYSRDFETGGENNLYLRMYLDALHSGFLGDIGAERWHTLCTIAAFMDKDGNCFPTQSQIAKSLGISERAAGNRIRKLLAYRWQGQPVVIAEKKRNKKTKQWANTTYRVLPISRLAIF